MSCSSSLTVTALYAMHTAYTTHTEGVPMVRSLLAACMAFAGVFVLAGAGWALLAGALLVLAAWRKEPDWAVLAARAAGAARRLATRAKAAPRRGTAGTGSGGGPRPPPPRRGVSPRAEGAPPPPPGVVV